MKNNRGDIPITILVIGVFAICAFAIISFVFSSISLRNSFVGIDIVENVNNKIEFKEFNNEDVNYFYYEINKTKVSLDYVKRGFKDEILFSVEYVKP
jgi:hypothetical protein